MDGELKIVTGRAHPALGQEICEYLNLQTARVSCYNFSDGEVFCQIDENVRGAVVFVVQPTCYPANESLMELLILLDALKRSSAARVTAVLPYYGYARQDKKDKPRVPITAKLVADLISAAGSDRVLTMDLHAPQIQGFFDIPVDHLFAAPVLLDAIKDLQISNLPIVSPEAGGVERARAIAKRIDAGLAIVDKRRVAPNEAEVMHVIGDVDGKNVLIIDDIIDTAGTIVAAADAIRAAGAQEVIACCTHAVLSGRALERLKSSSLKRLVVTDTIPLREEARALPNITVLSVAHLIGEAIRRIHNEESISSLFI